MTSKEAREKAMKVYMKDPDEVKRLAESGDILQRAAAITILQIIGETA